MSGDVRGCPGMSGDVRGCPGMSGDVRGCPGMSGDVRGCPGCPLFNTQKYTILSIPFNPFQPLSTPFNPFQPPFQSFQPPFQSFQSRLAAGPTDPTRFREAGLETLVEEEPPKIWNWEPPRHTVFWLFRSAAIPIVFLRIMMIPLQRSSSFSAYTYESDDDEEEPDVDDCGVLLCGSWDDDDPPDDDDRTTSCERTPLVSQASPVAGQRISRDDRLARTRNTTTNVRTHRATVVLAGSLATLLLLVVYEYLVLLRPGGEASQSALLVGASSSIPFSARPSTTTTSSTRYGEVWLIRHGEKDAIGQYSVTEGQSAQDERLRRMYDLSDRGWDRAHHLATLVAEGSWPAFAGLVASRPATRDEMLNAYPDVARDATSQSLVAREYQTLVPVSKALAAFRFNENHNNHQGAPTIRAVHAKGEIPAAALDIAQTAVAAAEKNRPSAVVLVSWDHCSLPTLIVEGLGCGRSFSSDSSSSDYSTDPRCWRCWPDDRFGDVLKLNVSLATTTTTTTTTPQPAGATEPTRVSHERHNIVSTILSMTGESYPADDYYYYDDDDDDSTGGRAASTQRPVSIEQSTPCTPSYCTDRPAAKHLVQCSCWDDASSSSSSRTLA